MRRLPIYFLIDVSESMVGDQIQLVEEGMATIIKELKTDPNALETVWISIIVFAGQPKTIVPLQEISTFYPPKFPIGSGTSLSRGLGHLMYELSANVVKTTMERKGDWKPIVFLFTDGVPTDDTSAAVSEWRNKWGKTANLIAISIGENVDLTVLTQLTDNVLEFKNTGPEAFSKFFKWVTDSIKVSSISVEAGSAGFELAELDKDLITKIDLEKHPQIKDYYDDNYVVIPAKCQNTGRLYLMKYKKTSRPSLISGFDIQTKEYRLVGGFQVDNSFTELSDTSNKHYKINTEELIGAPSCPCCGNQIAFAMCSCGQVHCIGDEEISTCPTCRTSAKYRYNEGGGGFDVNRSLG